MNREKQPQWRPSAALKHTAQGKRRARARQVMYCLTLLMAAAALVLLSYTPAFRHSRLFLLIVAGAFLLAMLIKIADTLVRRASKRPDKDSELHL